MNKKTFYKIIYILSFILVVFFGFRIHMEDILPTKYRIGLFILLALIFFFGGRVVFGKKDRPGWNVFFCIIFILIGVGSFFASDSIGKFLGTFEKLNQAESMEEGDFSVVVLKSSSYKNLKDLGEEPIIFPKNQDEDIFDEIKSEFSKQEKVNLSFSKEGDYLTNAKYLLDGKNHPILINETYRPMIEEDLPNFTAETKILGTVSIKTKADRQEASKIESGKSFNIYISGIDTYGDISKVSRSDVNIILSVNPTNHRILMTTIPRDSYVKIPGRGNNQYDKLTHAGIYGVDTSISTLENLFKTNIDYYVRVNFSSVEEIVDILGGVKVDNPRAFTSSGGVEFPAGEIDLDGKQALTFSRERYNLAEGDLDRGRNQIEVLKGIINKCMSPSILLNYNEILDLALKFMDTNLPSSKIIELVNNQIDYRKNWKIDSQDVKGAGVMGLPSYAMPGSNLYMYQLDEENLLEMAGNIENSLKENETGKGE